MTMNHDDARVEKNTLLLWTLLSVMTSVRQQGRGTLTTALLGAVPLNVTTPNKKISIL